MQNLTRTLALLCLAASALTASVAAQAQSVLRVRMSVVAYEEWVRQLRDQAYVELRLEER